MSKLPGVGKIFSYFNDAVKESGRMPAMTAM